MVGKITKNNFINNYLLNRYTLIGFVLGFLPIFIFFFSMAYGISNLTGFFSGLLYGFIAGGVFGFLTFLFRILLNRYKTIGIIYLILLIMFYIIFLSILWILNKGIVGPFH